MKQHRRFVTLLFIILWALPSLLFSQSSPQITAAEILKHIKYLASDQLEGRKAGSPGADSAAAYIANEFRSYGLTPIGDRQTYFQHFDFVADVKLGEHNTFSFGTAGRSGTLQVNKDFRPLGFSSSTTFEGALVFAGYGISDTSKKYDDYSGINVGGKAVIVLRNAPPTDSVRDLGQSASLRYKALKGA